MSNTRKMISSTEVEQKDDHFKEFFQRLQPKKLVEGELLANYQGIWFAADILRATLTFQKHFKANDSDIILATMPKSGTTWLKALTFSIVNRNNHSVDESPLLFSNPHYLVPFLEMYLYKDGNIPDIDAMPCPRILATHLPYQFLPAPFRIVPTVESSTFAETLWMYSPLRCTLRCKMGIYPYGPFWDHCLGYWNASLKNPQKVLFLKYEDLKKDINSSVKKIADYLGHPFSAEEEEAGLVEEIATLCSFENLKNLNCNKEGEMQTVFGVKHNSFFRKGEVGDWVNLVPPSMANRLEKLMQEKFGESGLTLDIHGNSV
ncbi:cytosolic sulfotransferase 15-like [Coffea eugenioides]|uniref:cytosolic sulfotransferase 15-like n=1 Tax=Coffea eugenioides TaxID=49369 RepID=UPI000F61026C|nr:cytosolic sulfotransferase 15-like [Coffea eugenioides]